MIFFLSNVFTLPITLYAVLVDVQKTKWVGCISHHEVTELLKVKHEAASIPLSLNISINLGMSESLVHITNEGLCTPQNVLMATWDELKDIKEKARKGQPGCYTLYDDGCKPWRISCLSQTTRNPASLCPPLKRSGAPTMVLGGFTMHRIAGDGMDPMVDTVDKISSLKLQSGHCVLDTCMGLGYTALEAARRVRVKDGEEEGEGLLGRWTADRGTVTTIEFDDASIEMARHNPWSVGLFDGSLPVRVLRGDACEVVRTFPDHSFHRVIHDPPARAICGTDLYSLEFYTQLRRVLCDDGVLYHYIGNPGSRESGTLYSGVRKRLQAAGFTVPGNAEQAFGLIATAAGEKVKETYMNRKANKRIRSAAAAAADDDDDDDERNIHNHGIYHKNTTTTTRFLRKGPKGLFRKRIKSSRKGFEENSSSA